MLYNYTRGRFLENRRESDKVRKEGVFLGNVLEYTLVFHSDSLGVSAVTLSEANYLNLLWSITIP